MPFHKTIEEDRKRIKELTGQIYDLLIVQNKDRNLIRKKLNSIRLINGIDETVK